MRKRDAATQLHLLGGLTSVTCAAASLWTSSSALCSGRPASLSLIHTPQDGGCQTQRMEQRCEQILGPRQRKYSQDSDSRLADAGPQIEHHQKGEFWAAHPVPGSSPVPGCRPGSSLGSGGGAQIPSERGSVQAVSLPRTGECLIRRTTMAMAVSSSFR